ncbi:hypothetical protein TELCIR_01392 [Teladorsagia circumcincta]|uniref:Anaphase-promoting complex subunit 4 WD40 domain-containing protein n=1 Tax=Teladorsagia circumcincta TaxID=45464 RepID=A0A2G9V465_TELCI|nr:hypothetical protein TELCIR_01392 [Teladorsagia circumcincta]
MDTKLFAWSPCSGWLCLASQVQSAVQINFFTHKGVRLEDVVVQRKSSVSAIAWHPLDVLVAIAWTDGLLAILSPEASIEFNVDEELKSKVTFLQWSADGKSLWAVLEDGKCIVYKLVTKSSTEKCGDCSLDYRIDFLAYYDHKTLLIALTSDMMLYHLTIMPDSTAVEKLKVKLNGKGSASIVLRENLLLICHQERDLRVWDLETEENGTISLQPSKGMISAGTMKGKVANWKRRPGESSVENTWRLQTGNQLAGKITSIEWCPMYSALAVNTDDELTILQEENSIICLRNKTPTKVGDKIVVWDAEGDLIVHFSFTMGMTDQQQYEAEAELASSQGRPVTAAARFIC